MHTYAEERRFATTVWASDEEMSGGGEGRGERGVCVGGVSECGHNTKDVELCFFMLGRRHE